MAKTFPELSAESRVLEARLRKMEIGEVILYAELNGLIGRDVQKKGRGNLNTARKRVENTPGAGYMFEVERNEGLRRVPASDAVLFGRRSADGIRSRARGAVGRILRVTNGQNLSEAQRCEVNGVLSYHAMVERMSTTKALEAIEIEVKRVGHEVPPDQAVALLSRLNGKAAS